MIGQHTQGRLVARDFSGTSDLECRIMKLLDTSIGDGSAHAA